MKPTTEMFLSYVAVALPSLYFLSIYCACGFEGFYQLAGGTNSYTIDCLKKAGLFQSITFAGNLFLTFLFLVQFVTNKAYTPIIMSKIPF
jgi:hypothetical protein